MCFLLLKKIKVFGILSKKLEKLFLKVGAWLFEGIVNFFVEKQMIDELKRGQGVESNERLGILSC